MECLETGKIIDNPFSGIIHVLKGSSFDEDFAYETFLRVRDNVSEILNNDDILKFDYKKLVGFLKLMETHYEENSGEYIQESNL